MIRTINYGVTAGGIEPSARQAGGIQGDHNVLQLKFTLSAELYSALCAEKKDGDILRYRFDAFDGTGGVLRSAAEELCGREITYNVSSALSGAGGNARVFLVITRLHGENTETELFSYPAKLYFVPCGEGDGIADTDRESLTTLAEVAREAAERAETAKETAVTAQGKTQAAAAAIESGSEFLFDGGGADNSLKVECVTDSELSATSENPIANKAVYERLEQTDAAISAKADSAAVAAARAELLLLVFPVGSIYASVSDASPADLFGGSWERIKGAFLWGAEDGETAGTAGGEKTHTLTVSELPAHTHEQAVAVANENGNANTRIDYNADGKANGYSQPDISTASAGGGQPHNNMPPYIAVYLWKRTA